MLAAPAAARTLAYTSESDIQYENVSLEINRSRWRLSYRSRASAQPGNPETAECPLSKDHHEPTRADNTKKIVGGWDLTEMGFDIVGDFIPETSLIGLLLYVALLISVFFIKASGSAFRDW